MVSPETLAAYDTAGTTTTTDDRTFLFFYDANGNVGQLVGTTSGANHGTLAAKYEYDPYGNAIVASGTYATANPYRFSTKPFDGITGQGYWGYRWYDPRLGRWLSRDPMGEADGPSLYRFVDNDPIASYDPLGLWTGGDHEHLTVQSFDGWLLYAQDLPSSCPERMKKRLKDSHVKQDSGKALRELKRHFNRDIDKPRGSKSRAAISAYLTYLEYERGNFRNSLHVPHVSLAECRDAIDALGRLSHSWQDYYAHAVVLVKDRKGHTHDLWTANPPITGTPDNPPGSTGKIVPSSWGVFDHGEHGEGEPGGSEGAARQTGAWHFVFTEYNSLLPEWVEKCRCYCGDL